MNNTTEQLVKEVLEKLYFEGKVSKCVVDGEEVYTHVDRIHILPPIQEKPQMGNSYNLLKRFDPPIPAHMMNWRGQVYEVTGVKDGSPVVSKFFALDKKEQAAEYLMSLDQGHVWLSDATDYVDPDYGMFTGRRKRVHLLSPDAIFRK